jgi:hypothetical protein
MPQSVRKIVYHEMAELNNNIKSTSVGSVRKIASN